MNVLATLREKIQKEKINIVELVLKYDRNNKGGLALNEFRMMVE